MQTTSAIPFRRPLVAAPLFCSYCDRRLDGAHLVVTDRFGRELLACSNDCRTRFWGVKSPAAIPPASLRWVTAQGRGIALHLSSCDCHACRGALVGEAV